MYFNINALKASYKKFETHKIGEPFFGILEILRAKKRSGKSKLVASEISNSLNEKYYLTQTTIENNTDLWTVVFSNDWKNQFKTIFKLDKKISTLDIFIIVELKRDVALISEEIINEYFISEFNLSQNDLIEMGIEIFRNESILNQKYLSDKKLTNSEIISGLNLSQADGCYTLGFQSELKQKLPGELAAGPYIQPLYASQKYLPILLFSKIDLVEFYSLNKETNLGLRNKKTKEFITQNYLLVGPPGTGKSKASSFIIKNIFDESHFPENSRTLQNEILRTPKFSINHEINLYSTQFHPSYTYEDFFEGLRPVKVYYEDSIDIQYLIVPGIFKSACQIARSYFEDKYSIKLVAQYFKDNTDSTKNYWSCDETTHLAHYRFKNRSGTIFYNGIPVQNTGNCKNVIDLSANPISTGVYNIEWFPDLKESYNPIFVFYIDELNRGNPSKIFGEALSLIEPIKRIGKSEEIEIILPYSHERFSIPPNISIVCAMNTSDKSLSSLDNAFRRRFKTINLAPQFDIVLEDDFIKLFNNKISVQYLKDLVFHFECINKSLKDCSISPECYIGHSFLIDMLREIYSEIKSNNEVDEHNLQILLKDKLAECWKFKLHPIIKDIVTEYRLSDFTSALISNLSKSKNSSVVFDISDADNNGFLDYLESSNPEKENFPWKKAS